MIELLEKGTFICKIFTKKWCFHFHYSWNFLYKISFFMLGNLKCSKAVRRSRSSRREVFCKKGLLRNLAKFTGKHLCQSPFFTKVTGLKTATLLKKRLWHRCFPVNSVKFVRTPFFIKHLW